ncbi:MAG TPA: site-2 protease family protein [Ohtaekwangia sp.]
MRKEQRQVLLQTGLFIATFISTTLAGVFWNSGKLALLQGCTWSEFVDGMEYSIPFLLILTVHELGHYFTARHYKIHTSLPYYIPFPPLLLPPIGTLGAVIRIRERVKSTIQQFDIGLAGPLAGFIVALFITAYGFATLPPADYVFRFHPEYEQYGLNYAEHVYSEEYMKEHEALDLQIGSNLLFEIFGYFVSDKQRIPNPHEMMHYPVLMAGFFALLFTALNLLPMGQLDGGHITYGLFGSKWHRIIATSFFTLVFFYSGLGMLSPLQDQNTLLTGIPLTIGFYYFCFRALSSDMQNRIMYALVLFAVQFILAWVLPQVKGYPGWFLFGFVVSRFIGIQHPGSEIEVPLDAKRIILGWIALLIFVLCVSPAPFIMSE